MALADKQCVPCRGGVPPLAESRARELLQEVGGDWRLNEAGHLACRYEFGNFVDAMHLANVIAEIAETEKHHPELQIGWGHCSVEVWTHKIDGLTESDFYLAAKIERAAAAPSA
jgi:4a-hydroxytetrahydrobiopterin dehydratase